jgi:secretion/DNA translocation related TadE-like protein
VQFDGGDGAMKLLSRQRCSDRGSATIIGAAVGLAVLSIGVVVAKSATDAVARAEARSAADLAALAGAGWARAGQSVACARAREFASANRAVMVSCVLDGLDIELSVEVKGIRAVARAGPVRGAGGPDAA